MKVKGVGRGFRAGFGSVLDGGSVGQAPGRAADGRFRLAVRRYLRVRGVVGVVDVGEAR
jgi:hypothetical protein